MCFEILGKIKNIETIAVGKSIRQLKRLEKAYGKDSKGVIGTMNKFVLCIENKNYPASLEKWKIYPVIKEKEKDGYIRIIDESGEDYLYPVEYFVSIELPFAVKEKLEKEYIEL